MTGTVGKNEADPTQKAGSANIAGAPKISIIVPVYNAESFIKETIESVRAQQETDWELILVDDCSRDNSREIINDICRQDSRIRLVALKENGGAAGARNRGVDEARGRYICYLDSDDLWRPDKLRRELAFMEAPDNKGRGFVFTGYEFADERGIGLGKVVKVPSSLNYEQALGNTTIFTSTVMFDTGIIPKELIKMPLVKSEDTACWWRILRSGYTAAGLDENLVLYRRTKGTLSSNKGEAIKRIWYLYREVEKLPLLKSARNFMLYAIRAVLRRV